MRGGGRKKGLGFFRYIILILMLLVVYAVVIEPRWFEVTTHEVTMKNIPSGTELKIVQIADFHAGHYMGESHFRKAVALVNEQKPDVVVLTGDFVNSDAGRINECAKFFSEIEAPLGVYAVLGNHDYWSDATVVTNALEQQGVRVLTNRNRRVAPGVTLVGIDDIWSGKPDIKKAFDGVDIDTAVIVLSHSPKILPRIKDREVLVLAAHTHAGQVDVPGVPRNKLPGLLGWRYIRGWYEEGAARMYVNRGIGMITPPVRFRCRPEISVFILGPDKSRGDQE